MKIEEIYFLGIYTCFGAFELSCELISFSLLISFFSLTVDSALLPSNEPHISFDLSKQRDGALLHLIYIF